tara:strand:+ start:550 stop:1002 length:453 start_codon:yes stop_codon:yes gene_type:complete
MDDSDEMLDDLLGQLKENNTMTNNVIKSNEGFTLSKEDLETFILNTSGRLIQDSLDMINVVKERVAGSAEPEDVTSLSELFKASTHTVEALNKILIQDKKTQTTLTVKQMDVESRKELADKSDTLMASRDDIIKLIHDAEFVDVTEIEKK